MDTTELELRLTRHSPLQTAATCPGVLYFGVTDYKDVRAITTWLAVLVNC